MTGAWIGKAFTATAFVGALMLTATSSSGQQQSAEPRGGMQSMHGMGAKEGMEGMQGMQGRGGMMGMMGSCNRMMGGAPMHGMPQLPPGNAKLQLQMQAEMMQKVGEVLAKYAQQVSEVPR